MVKKIEKYFSQHPTVNALSHLLVGLGIGALLTHSVFDPHPVRYGLFFLVLGGMGHLYVYLNKK